MPTAVSAFTWFMAPNSGPHNGTTSTLPIEPSHVLTNVFLKDLVYDILYSVTIKLQEIG